MPQWPSQLKDQSVQSVLQAASMSQTLTEPQSVTPADRRNVTELYSKSHLQTNTSKQLCHTQPHYKSISQSANRLMYLSIERTENSGSHTRRRQDTLDDKHTLADKMLSVEQSVTPTARTGTVPQWVSRLSQSHTTPQTRVFTRHCPTRRCVRRHGHETRNNFHPCSVTPPCMRAMLTRHLNPCCEPPLIPYLAWQAQYGVTRTSHQKLVVIPLGTDVTYVFVTLSILQSQFIEKGFKETENVDSVVLLLFLLFYSKYYWLLILVS